LTRKIFRLTDSKNKIIGWNAGDTTYCLCTVSSCFRISWKPMIYNWRITRLK